MFLAFIQCIILGLLLWTFGFLFALIHLGNFLEETPTTNDASMMTSIVPNTDGIGMYVYGRDKLIKTSQSPLGAFFVKSLHF